MANDGPDVGYRGWDVHAYTPALMQRIQEWRDANPVEAITWSRPMPQQTALALGDWYVEADPAAAPVFRKMASRTSLTESGWFYGDADLGGINIWALYATARRIAIRPDNAMGELLAELVRDAAQTCIQGDSHRILMFIFANTRTP